MKRLLGGLFATALVLMLCGVPSALGAGTPSVISAGTHPDYLSVAVETNGTAVAAWADDSNPGHDVVRWCVVPAGSGACTGGGGSLTPAASTGTTNVFGTQVLVDGSTVVILADVEVGNTEAEVIQEWQSTNGGQSFALVNGGRAVASGNPDTDTQGVGGVVLPGGNYLGVPFTTPNEAPTFHAFALNSPTLCGRTTYPVPNCGDGYAKLAPSSDADQVSNEPASFASNSEGVLGVFRTNFTSGSLGCSGGSPFGMAYVFGTGSQQPGTNDYNVSPYTEGTAWGRPVTQGDCEVDYLAAGAGPSGFGVLEDNQATGQTVYHSFDVGSSQFDKQPVVVSTSGEQQPSLSQDGAGGVYATYISGGIGGPVSLSYSANGGTTWAGPATLTADPLGAISGLTSAVDPSGRGWATWIENGSVFVQPFSAADTGAPAPVIPPPPASSDVAPTTLTTTQTQVGGGRTGASISVPPVTAVTEQATIVGANAAHASGGIEYALYSTPHCEGSPIVHVQGGVSGAFAASVTITTTMAMAPGNYYWHDTYSGNASTGPGTGNAPSESACGSEVLTVTSPNAIAGQATSDGKTLTFGASCAVVPCALGATATAGAEPAATMSASSGRKAKTVTLGKAKFRITKKGTQKLTLKLSGAGRRYLAHKHKAKVALALTEKIGTQNVVTKRTLSVKVSHHKGGR